MGFLAVFAGMLLFLLWLLVLARVLLSWVDPAASNQLSRWVYQATEPLLAPVRRLLPTTGMFDLSALLVLIILGALWRRFL
jgi:YggT family protein